MLDAAGPCQGSSLAPLVVSGGVLASLEPRSSRSQHHCTAVHVQSLISTQHTDKLRGGTSQHWSLEQAP